MAQRDDRNIAELIQELRVAGLGVQVLFGFLLSLPFTTRFTKLDGGQRDLYLTSLVLSAVATILLIGPVAYHRLVFRRGMKERLVRFANLLAILGLAAVGGAVLAAVLLVTVRRRRGRRGRDHRGDRPACSASCGSPCRWRSAGSGGDRCATARRVTRACAASTSATTLAAT